MSPTRTSVLNGKKSLRSRDAKRIMEYLDERKSGAEAHMVGHALHLHFQRVISILKNDLEPKGEVWRKSTADDGAWYLTNKYVPTKEPAEIARILKREIEQELFGLVPPYWANEFAAGIRAGLSIEDAWHFAHNKIIEAHPELKVQGGQLGAET